MRLHQRAAAIVATEGFTGLVRRGVRKLLQPLRPQPAPVPTGPSAEDVELERQKALFPGQVSSFHEQVRARGLGDVEHFYWYHAVDLGNGLVTPGDYDFRAELGPYQFPESMRGLRVLDVGSATGFFAFEFERRGAEVVSVDLPSLADWDMVWSDRQPLLEELMRWQQAANIEELQWKHLEGPFRFCHQLLGSKVSRCLSRIYDLTPEKVGGMFDLVYVGDVLCHLFSPLAALNALAPLCRGRMIIAANLYAAPGGAPVMVYTGGASASEDSRSWFHPSWECLRRMLCRLGFDDVRVVGHSRVLVRRAWMYADRAIVHAAKSGAAASGAA
jgi:tRNA (mo5U34)-methyltransferase